MTKAVSTPYTLEAIYIEDICGFKSATVPIKGSMVFVGENSSGKTSILQLINWVFNGLDRDLLEGRRNLTEKESALLIPARVTRNRAKRLFLQIRLNDGRKARVFNLKRGDLLSIRVQFRTNKVFAKVSSPTRGEDNDSEAIAVDAIEALQDSTYAHYIDPYRNSYSDVFQQGMIKLTRNKLLELLNPKGRGGATRDSSDFAKAIETIHQITSKAAEEVWNSLRSGIFDLPVPEAKIGLDLNRESVIDLLLPSLEFRPFLGKHDANGVGLDSIGSGKQSLIGLTLGPLLVPEDVGNKILLVEEPETFLHPNMHRFVAQRLFGQHEFSVIVTSHSPAVLKEASITNISVVRDHEVFRCLERNNLQTEKDTALLRRAAADSFFASSVLLVEGPGEVAFFEVIRQKLEGRVNHSILDRMTVVAVGSKSNFAPWLRLYRRFADPNAHNRSPWNVIVNADSIDAVTEVRAAFRELSIPELSRFDSLEPEKHGKIDSADCERKLQWLRHATEWFNKNANKDDYPVHFNILDLEYAMLGHLDDQRVREIGTAIDLSEDLGKTDIISTLGSKGINCKSVEKAKKQPYLRRLIAQELDLDNDLSADCKLLINRWVRGTGKYAENALR